MRGLGSPSFSVGMPSPPPKNRRLVCGWVWERGEGIGEGRDVEEWRGIGRDEEGWGGVERGRVGGKGGDVKSNCMLVFGFGSSPSPLTACSFLPPSLLKVP